MAALIPLNAANTNAGTVAAAIDIIIGEVAEADVLSPPPTLSSHSNNSQRTLILNLPMRDSTKSNWWKR